MANPTDPNLARLVTVTTEGDYTGVTDCAVADHGPPPMSGPYWDSTATPTFTVLEGDHDRITASTDPETHVLVTVGTTPKVVWVDGFGPHNGQIYYWNGNNDFSDWINTGPARSLFLNILDLHLRTVFVLHDGGIPVPGGVGSLLTEQCFTNAEVENADELDDEITADYLAMRPYPVVIFNNDNRAITVDEQAALTQYVESGGVLIVTGHNSLATPTDTVLADLLRVTVVGDGPASGACAVVDDSYPVFDGPYGTYPAGTTFTVTATDHDQVSADVTLGSVELISVGPAGSIVGKLIYAPDLGPRAGRIYYWNGNEDIADWTATGSTSQQIFLNLLATEITRAPGCLGG